MSASAAENPSAHETGTRRRARVLAFRNRGRVHKRGNEVVAQTRRGEHLASLDTQLLGASVRGDRETLMALTRNAADRFGISQHDVLVAWACTLSLQAAPEIGDPAAAMRELEALPASTLVEVAHHAARLLYLSPLPPSRAS